MANGYVGVPTSYTPVEYIESTGTQYIDTGIVRDIVHKYRFIANLSWDDVTTRQSVGAQGYVYFGVVSGYYQIAQGGTAHTNVIATANTFVDIDITFNCPAGSYTGTVNNQAINSASVSYNNTPANAHITLFSLNDMVLPSSVKISTFKIYQDDVLVRDFIAVQDDNSVPCLYDLVEGKFYYNKGTGTFTTGSATGQPVSLGDRARKIVAGYVGVPMSYTPVEYIESSGTQYINTGVIPYQTQTEIKFAQVDTTGDTTNGICGGWNENNNRYYVIYASLGSSPKRFSSYKKDGTEIVLQNSIDSNQHIVIYNDSNNKVFFDGVEKGTVSNFDTQGTKTILLFSVNWERGPSILATSRIYYAKITDKSTNTLIRDYIPVLDTNNVACLYEQVEGKFYYNNGSGNFTAGNATGSSVSLGDRARKIVRGYVGVNGVAKLMWRGHMYSSLRIFERNSPSKFEAYVTRTKDYVLVGAGYESSNNTTNAKVKAYDINCIETACTDLPATARRGMTMRCGDYGIMAGGNYNSNNGNVRTNCTAYDNNLTRTTMTGLSQGVFDAQSTGNDTHCILNGGSNYSQFQTACQSYNNNLVKSSLSNDSQRVGRGSSSIGNYILLVGARASNTSVSIYDNSNVKTTASNPYNKISDLVLGVNTDEYAMFFGGNTLNGTNDTYSSDSIVAYDENLVKTTSTLPGVNSAMQGFTFAEKYALVIFNNEALIYDNNFQIQERFTALTTRNAISLAEASSTFGLVLINGSLLTTQIIF